MNKKYCTNCKHKKYSWWKWCESPKKNVYERGNEFTGVSDELEIVKKEELNKNGECPLYEEIEIFNFKNSFIKFFKKITN